MGPRFVSDDPLLTMFWIPSPQTPHAQLLSISPQPRHRVRLPVPSKHAVRRGFRHWADT